MRRNTVRTTRAFACASVKGIPGRPYGPDLRVDDVAQTTLNGSMTAQKSDTVPISGVGSAWSEADVFQSGATVIAKRS